MANEAFALSPMSARAAQPNEADYDAISEAFMETARGRWFLGEYAKRNRNADTRMVLDAVAKIEETLAAQRQPVVVDRLPEALVAIRSAVTEAEAAAGATFDRAAVEASIAPVNRGLRIIKEISWRWREIGADGRICDLIDSQLAAIEAACRQIAAIDPRDGLKAAFELLRDRIEQTDAGNGASPQPAAARPAPAPEVPRAAEASSAAETPPAAAEAGMTATEPFVTPAEMVEPAAAPEPQAMAAEDAPETMGAEALAPTVATDAPDLAASRPSRDETMTEPMVESMAEPLADPLAESMAAPDAALEAEAEDDAVLQRIAFEMAAPDPDFDDLLDEPAEIAPAPPIAQAPIAAAPMVDEPVVNQPALDEATLLDQPVFAEPVDDKPVLDEAVLDEPVLDEPALEQSVLDEPVAAAPIPAESFAQLREAIAEAAIAVMERPAMERPETMQTRSLPMPSPVAETSLGASLLASGILQRPRTPANDPLAPIRRMTQAEKIAFFS